MSRVLIVDDSRALRWSARRILEDLGMEVEEAENGKHALDRCSTGLETFDVILLDIDMPVMDGMSFLESFRRDVRHDNTIVIMCSTDATPETIHKALSSGANDYIMKPFTPDVMSDKLRGTGISV